MGIGTHLILQTLVYGFVFWFSLYLLQYSTEQKLRYTALGLGTYALALAFDLLARLPAFPDISHLFNRLHWGFLILPSIFWTGATLQLLPTQPDRQPNPRDFWQRTLLPVGILTSLLLILTPLLWHENQQTPTLIGYFVFLTASLLPMLTGIWVIRTEVRQWQSAQKQKRRSIGLILTAALFFALGSGGILLQSQWLPHPWAILAIGVDLEILGFAIAYLDAFEQGETLWPDFLRSFALSALVAVLFGGQIAFAMAISTGITLPMMILLLTTVSLAIFTQVYTEPIQTALDRLIFARFPRLRQERAELRGVAAALPRTTPAPLHLPPEEETFTRYTRRALSHLNDLPKLAANPLTHLPIIETRLHARNIPLNTLARAAELKTLLIESIIRLKPSTGPFGTTDAWRFYNALYYPYVLGLRPYSRRAEPQTTSEAQTILAWFRTTVPERTLHNWQTTAAALIAKDLREQEKSN